MLRRLLAWLARDYTLASPEAWAEQERNMHWLRICRAALLVTCRDVAMRTLYPTETGR